MVYDVTLSIGTDYNSKLVFLQGWQGGVGPAPILLQPIGDNVGIGLTNPSSKLTVDGTVEFRSGGNLLLRPTANDFGYFLAPVVYNFQIQNGFGYSVMAFKYINSTSGASSLMFASTSSIVMSGEKSRNSLVIKPPAVSSS